MRLFSIRTLLFVLCILLVLPLAAGAQSGGEIAIGETINGELTVSQPSLTYRYQGHAGDVLSISLTSDAFDAYLTLQDADGFNIASDDDSGGGSNAALADITLPRDGVYLIIVDSFNRASSGAFSLTLQGTQNIPPEPVTAGAIQPGQTLAGELAGDILAAAYTFTGTAGQSVTITLLSEDFDSYLVLKDAAGTDLVSDDDSAGNLNARIGNFALPADGTYTIIATSYNNATPGNFTLTLEVAGAAITPIQATPTFTPTPAIGVIVTPVVSGGETPITPGQAVTGLLAANSTGATFIFDGRAGEQVTILLESGAFDAYLTLQDATGNILATDDDSAGNLNARIRDFALPADGTYTIIASSFSGAASGPFTITLESTGSGAVIETTPTPVPPVVTVVPATGDTLQPNVPLAGTLSAEQPTVSYTFTGTAGQSVTITLESDAFDSYLTLQDAAGNDLATDDDSAGSLNARISDFALPADGVYTVVVNSFIGAAAGDFTLTLEMAGGSAVVPTPLPPVVTVVPATGDTLLPNVPLAGTLSAEQPTMSYTFTGAAGQNVTITLESDAFDAYLTLQDARGNVLATDDDSAGSLNARITDFALPADGTYTAVVSSFAGSAAGDFTLTLETAGGSAVVPTPVPPVVTVVPAAGDTLLPNMPLAGTLTAEQPTMSYTFTGAAGQRVTITLESTAFDAFLILHDPSGTELIGDDDSAGNLNARISDFALPGDGLYTVLVTSFGGTALGDFTLTLETAGSGVVVPTPVPPLVTTGNEIAAGQIVSGELTDSQLSVTYRLVGEAGSAVSIMLNSEAFDAFLTVQDAAGNEVASDDDGGGNLNSRIAVFRLEAGQTYSIVASSLGGTAIGAYTLQVDSVTFSSGGPITIGESLTGYADGGYPSYTFSADVGEMVVITLRSEDFDSFVRLYDSQGSVLASDDDSGGNLDAQISFFTIPASGEYTIQVEAYSGEAAVGAYTLSVATVTTRPVEYTQEVQAALDTANSVLGFRFRGQAGDVIAISMNSDTFDSYLTLTSAEGVMLVSNDDGGGDLNALIGPFTLPETGDYIIGARGYDANAAGPFTLRLERVVMIPVMYGGTITGTFDATTSAIYYSFEGSSGDMISLAVAGDNGLDTTLLVNGPGNYQVGYDDDSGRDFDPEINRLVLNESGTYVVIVRPFDSGTTGTFTLAINGLLPAALEDGAQQIYLSSKRSQDTVVFKGVAGETVTIVARMVSGSPNAEPSVDVQQAGTYLAYETLSGDSEVRMTVTVPENGVVSVLVSDYSYEPVIVEVRLERP